MLGPDLDTDFEWRLKAGRARRAERDPHPVGPGSDAPEGKAAIRLALHGLHHLPCVVHQLHQSAAHGLQGFAPARPHHASDLAPERECGGISFHAPCAVRREANGLRPVPQDQVNARDSPGRGLDPHLERGMVTAPAQRAGCDAHPVPPGCHALEHKGSVQSALHALDDTSLIIHQLHQRGAHGPQRACALAPDLARELARAAQEHRLSRRGLGLRGRSEGCLLQRLGALREANGLRSVPCDQVDF